MIGESPRLVVDQQDGGGIAARIKDIDIAVLVDITGGGARSRAEGQGAQLGPRETGVILVDIEFIGHATVGDEEIDIAVVLEVKGDGVDTGGRIANVPRRRLVTERTALVDQEPAAPSVVGKEGVKLAVRIEISCDGGKGGTGIIQPVEGGRFAEFGTVRYRRIIAVGGIVVIDIDVFLAVVVEIGPAHALRIENGIRYRSRGTADVVEGNALFRTLEDQIAVGDPGHRGVFIIPAEEDKKEGLPLHDPRR